MLVFTTFWSLKTAHVLLLHHVASEHPVCDASHDANLAHIHDERWANDDCTLCAFVVSASEIFSLPALPALKSKIPDSEAPVFYFTPVFSKKACDSAMRRGPPVA
jgi:hypothetical protein